MRILFYNHYTPILVFFRCVFLVSSMYAWSYISLHVLVKTLIDKQWPETTTLSNLNAAEEDAYT